MTLSATTLLNAWEDGLGLGLTQRALLLLALCPATTTPAKNLAGVCLGERDGHLLKLRRYLFGSRVDAAAACPICNEPLEMSLHIEDIIVDAQPSRGESYWVNVGVGAGADTNYDVRYRLPTSADLIQVALKDIREAQGVNLALARAELLRFCVLEVYCQDANGSRVAASAHDLPEEAIAAMTTHMAQMDPQGDVQLALSCPACRHSWLAPFDVVSFLWAEVEAWAQHLLHEVHTLAAGYGWHEADILAMSAWRRGWYLQALT